MFQMSNRHYLERVSQNFIIFAEISDSQLKMIANVVDQFKDQSFYILVDSSYILGLKTPSIYLLGDL